MIHGINYGAHKTYHVILIIPLLSCIKLSHLLNSGQWLWMEVNA